MRYLLWPLLSLLLCGATGSAQTVASVSGTKRALLIGINTYQPADTQAKHAPNCRGGRCDLPTFQNLQGPTNDVMAMRDLLSSPKFGFAPQDIAVLTNPGLAKSELPFVSLSADQTNHDALLATMRHYLVELPNSGDTVVFYYAGHGSLRVNSKGTKLAMMVDGKPSHADSTLVPADAWTGVHDLRDRETTRIFNDALDKGVHLTVILDSCHSGSFTRGIELGQPFVERSLGYDPDDIQEGPDLLPSGEPVPSPAERKTNPALVFSAAQQDQTAKERVFGQTPATSAPHGAFTLALLQALETLPADAPAAVVYQHVRAALEAEGVPDQNPSLDSGKDRLQQPFFGGTKSGSNELRAASIGTDDEGHVLLDAGQLSGIDVGTEFESITPDAKGKTIKLSVQSLEGLTHSRAKVVSPVQAHVTVPQVFRLSKWVPRQVDALHFWTWPANLSDAAITAAGQQVVAAGFHAVEDPVEQPWTDMLAWNGTAWELRHVSTSTDHARTTTLGPELTAAALKAALPSNARLWVNLPPPSELSAKLALHENNSLVIGVDDVTQADYILAGTLTANGAQWAWYHKAEYLAGPKTAVKKDHSPGCSIDSPYPVSSDWVLLQDATADSTDATSEVLNNYAGLLAKVNGWLNLSGDPALASPAAYYKLRFKPVGAEAKLPEDQPVKQDDRLKMVLSATSPVTEQRWVYVLDIDCHGKSTLLYPYNSTGSRFPNDADSPHELELPGAPTLKIGAPFGVDTVLLISTQEPLPDPSGLEFSGVSTRGAKPRAAGADTNPLQQLLTRTSAGTRGAIPEMPTNWSIDAIPLRSIPK
jgi:hypothetical protein